MNKWIIVLFLMSAQAFAEYLPVMDKDLRVIPGSALDFSTVFSQEPVQHTVKLNKNGKFYLTDNNLHQRFFCAPMTFTPVHGGFPSHAEADQLAFELRKKGYNLVRFHALDKALMALSIKDFEYSKEHLDRFWYFLGALKKQGIYWMMDAATSPKGFAQNDFPQKLNLMVHYDAKAQARWKKQVNVIFTQKNPYTGLILAKDPALLGVTLFNEGGLAFNTRKEVPAALKSVFFNWMAEKHPDEPKVFPEKNKRSKQQSLLQTFYTELEIKTYDWMKTHLQSIGFEGLITAYNNGKKRQVLGVKSHLDLVTVHGYFDHPKKFIRPGNSITNQSAISEGLPLVKYLSLNRFYQKPFIVDEYDHVYWNRYRYEAPMVAAFASFQDWDGICRFQQPVILDYDSSIKRQTALFPFAVGVDPVARATETLAALLYRRGDVSIVDSQAVFAAADKFRDARSGQSWFPDHLGKQALLTQVGWEENEKTASKSENSAEIGFDSATKQGWINTPKTQAVFFVEDIADKTGNLKLHYASEAGMVSLSSLDNQPLASSQRVLMIIATDAIGTDTEFSADRTQLTRLGRLPARLLSSKIELSWRNKQAKNMQLYALGMNGERKKPWQISVDGDELHLKLNTADLGKDITFYFEWAVED